MGLDFNLNNINNYIDKDEANSTTINLSPDSSLDVSSFDNEAVRYWNESLQALYEKYKELISNDINDGGADSIKFSLKQGADAGYHFKEGEPYVIPDENADGQTYEEVRGNDKIEDVLQNENNLQFTREKEKQKKHYLRLIMPKYGRRVEVEDLDRNFWVIGQAIDQICSFLFDDESPLNIVLRNILNELLGIWQNIYLLWGKSKDNEQAINDLGSQVAKSNLFVHLTNDGANSYEFIRGEIYKQTGIDIDISLVEDNARLNNIYFFGSKINDKGEEINPIPEWFINEEAQIKRTFSWLFKDNKFIYQDVKEVDNTNGDGEFYSFCGRFLTPDQRKILTFPRIGGIVKYTLNDNDIHYLAYDYKHPYVVTADKTNMIYGKMMKYAIPLPEIEYKNGTMGGQTIFSLNRYIYEESRGQSLNQNISDLGAIIHLDRMRYDKRNFSEILYDLSQLNIIFTSNTVSASNIDTVCDWDIIPSERHYSQDDLYKGMLTIFAKACDYGVTAQDDYYYIKNNGSGDEIVFVHTALVPLFLEALKRGGIVTEDVEKIKTKNYFYFDDPSFLSFLESNQKENLDYSAALDVYKLYNFSSLENYTIFVNKVLKDFGISFADYCQEHKDTVITIQNISNYKDDYELFCYEKIKSLSDEQFLYLKREYYSEEGVWGNVVSNPLLLMGFNDAGTGYTVSPKLTYDDEDFGAYSPNYYLTKNLANSSTNTWKCVFNLLPSDIFVNKNKLQAYEDKLWTIEDHYLLPSSDGGGIKSEKNALLDIGIYGYGNVQLTQDCNTKNWSGRCDRCGVIEGFKTNDPANIKTQYLQPFDKFTGYWLYIKSGSFLQNFLATPHVSGYNIRALDGGGGFNFYDSAFILKAFNPYDTSKDTFNKETINRIYEFNNPELQPLYLHHPDEHMTIRPTILNRGKADNLRYLARNGNNHDSVVDTLLGVGTGVPWEKGLESYSLEKSENSVILKNYLQNTDLTEEERSKLNFNDDTIVYLASNEPVLSDEDKQFLEETEISYKFRDATYGYFSKGNEKMPIYSPTLWYSTDAGNSWSEWTKEFNFLFAAPYDSIYVYGDNNKELTVSHKKWKNFTVEDFKFSEYSNDTIVSLIEFLKDDQITEYNIVKTMVKFSIIKEREADNTANEIKEMVKDPGIDYEPPADEHPPYDNLDAWLPPAQIDEEIKSFFNEVKKQWTDDTTIGSEFTFNNYKGIIIDKQTIDSNSAYNDGQITYYDIKIDYTEEEEVKSTEYYRFVRVTEGKRGYYPYYLTGCSVPNLKIQIENQDTFDWFYDFGNHSNTNTLRDADNHPISGIGGKLWGSRYDLFCWYNRISLTKNPNSIYENYSYNYNVQVGDILIISPLKEEEGKKVMILPPSETISYDAWIHSPIVMYLRVDGTYVCAFYDSIMGKYKPQLLEEYSGDWKHKNI